MILAQLTLLSLAPWVPDELQALRKAEVRMGPPPSPNRAEFPFKGSIIFQGIPIYVENPKGTMRTGVAKDGRKWSTLMTAHYGEFAGTLGVDGDAVDVFVGPDPEAPVAYVVHRKHPGTQVYDEDKVILGTRSVREAEALFRANYDLPGNLGGVTPWPVEELRDYLLGGKHDGVRLDRPRRVRLLIKASPVTIKASPDRLHGGRADNREAGDFDPEALGEGAEHEREHTDDAEVAREIAMDHLAEDPDYYRKLARLEKDASRAVAIAAQPGMALMPSKSNPRVKRWQQTRAPVAPPTVAPTPAKATYAYIEVGGIPGAYAAACKQLFGRQVDPVDVARAAGIVAGSNVTIRPSNKGDKLMIEAQLVKYGVAVCHQDRTFRHADADEVRLVKQLGKGSIAGSVVCENELFHLNKEVQGAGIGATALWQQVQACRDVGIGWITTFGVGSQEQASYPGGSCGYYTWPRLGFDGLINADDMVRSRGARPPAGEETFGELMRTTEGREWWKKHGEARAFAFNTDDDSPGAHVLENYVRMRQQAALNKAQVREGRVDADVLSDADEALLDRIWAAAPRSQGAQLSKGAALRLLLKATIKTPRTADGKVDYDAVPVGGTIWVTVTNPASPLHGRPIMITKRPDHQFALTGGSGAKQVQARRHLAMQGGKISATKADEALDAQRKEIAARNAPKKALLKEHQHTARKEQKAAEVAFMAALGIAKHGLSDDEKEKVRATAEEHAKSMGFEDKDARAFAKTLADSIAKKDTERRVQQAAQKLDIARWIVKGEDPEDAADMAGPVLGPLAISAPEIRPEEWAALTPQEQEHAIVSHVDQVAAQQHEQEREAMRFEDEGQDGDGDGDGLTGPTPTTDLEEIAASGNDAAEVAHETSVVPGEDHADYANGDAPQESPAPATASGPTFTIGHSEPAAVPQADDMDTVPITKPIVNQEQAQAAVARFKEYAAAQQVARMTAKDLEDMPEGEPAAPAAVEELRLRASAMTDDEVDALMDRHIRQAMEATDTAFYDALSPHWNEDVGNKLAGAVTTGAAAAITGIVGDEIGARYDVQGLVNALGPETAAIAVAQRMREDMEPKAFDAFVRKLRDHNATNQRETEGKALSRHRELQRQSDHLERQIGEGDLQAKATVALLRARNIMDQRENLGGALGSMQASAALYDAAEKAAGMGWRKRHPVQINVGSKAALEDKLKRLGGFRHEVRYNLQTSQFEIHTDTEALRKFVAKTESNTVENEAMRQVKFDATGITHDDEGREWAHDYKVPGFRSHFSGADALPPELKHMAGKPISLQADQRNNIEWIHQSGGGLVNMRTGGGKTLVSVAVAAKMLEKNPQGRHLRVVPDGREEQWANEISTFTNLPVTVLPGVSTKEERLRLLANAPPGGVVIVGHKNAGKTDHKALAELHQWDSVGIDEPQELRSKKGSKMSAGAKRIFKIPAENRHALTATPATDHPVEAYDIVNWAKPGAMGFRSRFSRSFEGFGGGTNAQDAALQRSLYRELEPHISADRQVSPHYRIEHHDRSVSMSASQLTKQREIESRVDAAVEAAVAASHQKKRDGIRSHVDKSWAVLRREATDKAMAKLEQEHRVNLGGGDTNHNPKIAEFQRTLGTSAPSERHVVFVDSPEQRRSVIDVIKQSGRPSFNIDTTAKNAVNIGEDGEPISAIEERKRKWKASEGGVIVIDRTSASGHNLAEGHHLHVLGDPDDAAQMLQAHGRLGRSNRVGDFAIHTYRYDDSPFAHHTWNRLNRQIKVLKATAPTLFVKGKPAGKPPVPMMAKGRAMTRALVR